MFPYQRASRRFASFGPPIGHPIPVELRLGDDRIPGRNEISINSLESKKPKRKYDRKIYKSGDRLVYKIYIQVLETKFIVIFWRKKSNLKCEPPKF